MSTSNIIDLDSVIGVYAICNTGCLVVHEINEADDTILVSLNGENPEWCDMKEGCVEGSGEPEIGFYWGEMFVPLSEVMRFT